MAKERGVFAVVGVVRSRMVTPLPSEPKMNEKLQELQVKTDFLRVFVNSGPIYSNRPKICS